MPHRFSRPAAGAPIRVFVCDDTEEFRLLLRALLEDEGMEVVGEAADGAAVTDRVAAMQPDVVVLDLSMPRRDGLEALPGIRRAAPGTRIVVLSGLASDLVGDRCRDLGAHAYVQKGASIGSIVAAVRGDVAA